VTTPDPTNWKAATMPELEPVPFLDAHVHHWDPANLEWYPHLSPDADLSGMGMGDVSGMQRLFVQETYLAEVAPWPVEGYVHVSAATGPGMHLPETEQLAALAAATGSPQAIIGTVDPAGSVAAIAAELDRQVAAGAVFRGIRILDGLEYDTPRAAQVLGLLAERGLVYDLVVHPDGMLAAARTLEQVPDLPVVVEHTGWPMRPGDPAERATWEQGMSAFAQRPATTLKFSGLPMALHEISAAAFRPWFEHSVAAFGSERVLIGSNFPVDGLFGTLTQLLDAYLELAAPLGPAAVADLFAGTARRVYLKG
jgi:L-fuconolactonase